MFLNNVLLQHKNVLCITAQQSHVRVKKLVCLLVLIINENLVTPWFALVYIRE